MDTEVTYQELQPLVSALLHRYGSDSGTREELHGEIYFQFRKLVDDFDSSRGIPLKAYVIYSLPLRVRTWARSRWRLGHRECAFEETRLRPGLRLDDPALLFSEQARQEEVNQTLHRALARLPVRQRDALTARYYGNQSYAEISRTLGIKENSVRSLVRHAVGNLKGQFRQHGLIRP